MNAAICVPLNAKTKLVGLLVLARKKSGIYNQEDLQILETLSNHSALAIQNLKLQERLREATELESFYKFTSFVIHDLRNVVSVMAMLSTNAKKHMEDAEFRETLKNNLSSSVEKMRAMLSKVSMVSGSLSLAKTTILLVNLLESILDEIRLPANINVIKKFNLKPEIEVDQEQLRKVFRNLILNAIEALPDGGDITIEVSQGASGLIPLNIRSDWNTRRRFILVSVKDSGLGMTHDFMETQLFKPFQTTKKKGLGIGLYHCKEIIELHKGHIGASSQTGVGSCFYVSLPLANRQNQEEVEQEKVGAAKLTEGDVA